VYVGRTASDDEVVMIQLSKIFIYPIKALPGVQLNRVTVTDGGALYNDRRWGLVDSRGGMINGKNNRRIFLLNPVYDLASETVSFINNGGIDPVFELADTRGLSAFFSEMLGKPVFLQEDKRQGFPDDLNASGPTLVSQSSLEAVASWYPNLSLDDVRARFRVNLEVSPTPAFWEDQVFRDKQTHKNIQIGNVAIKPSNPCARCAVPMKHPRSGESYDHFYEIFINMREQTKPSWLDTACFDHWYRLSVNTNIEQEYSGKTLALGDPVST
jgi:uncharacterized protein YcbX